MNTHKAKQPFRFYTMSGLTQTTGRKAKNLSELIIHLKEVPESAVYHHTHRFLKQHQSLSPESPNDFAYWIQVKLQEEHLGEEVYGINTVAFPTVRELKLKMIEILEKHEAVHGGRRDVVPGNEFRFMQSVYFVLPTQHEAWDLASLAAALRKIDTKSIDYHVFEARLRPPLGINDFSTWLKEELGETSLAERIANLDPYTQTYETLRAKIISIVESGIREELHV